MVASFLGELADVPDEGPADGSRYGWKNHFWESADAMVHYGLVRAKRPARYVEVGCGWSSLLLAQALQRNAAEGHPCDVTLIEPYPRETIFDHLARPLAAPPTDPAAGRSGRLRRAGCRRRPVLRRLTLRESRQRRIRGHPIAALRAGRHLHRVLAQMELTRLVFDIAPHPVQMDGVRHHRVVDQDDPKALAVEEANGLGAREFDAVERPREPLHVACQVPLDGAARLPAIGIVEEAPEVGVRQHPPLLRRPVPGSSSFGLGVIVCMSTSGLLRSLAGCACMGMPPMSCPACGPAAGWCDGIA